MDKEKWAKVSECEKQWWISWKSRTDLGKSREELIGRAKDIDQILKKHLQVADRTILQIGPAANGEIHFLSGRRFAIDPLASFFKDNFPQLIDTEVDFVDGFGEKMPYDDSRFDAIIMLNVLDHCFNPSAVLKEICRCLKKGGVLIFGVNLYSPTASILHKVFNFLDKEHPHAITSGYLKRQFRAEYNVLEERFTQNIGYGPSFLKNTILRILRLFKLSPVFYLLVARLV